MFLVALSITEASAQVPGQSHFKTDTSAVMVDVVVRDKKGNPVTGLTKADFEVLEDGVPQAIGEVTSFESDSRSRATAPAGRGPHDPATVATPASDAAIAGPTFTALILDRLSPAARALAREAALACVDAATGPNDYVGVFVSDLTLVTLQPYTTDHGRLRAAVDSFATRATTASGPDATGDPLAAMRLTGSGTAGGDPRASVPVVASAESPGRTFALSSAAMERRLSADEAVLAAMLAEDRTHAAWEGLSRDRDGYATTNALQAVVAGLSALPGRKTVVFFAEGLAIPDRTLPQFRSVVASANRSNVSIYTVDAAGLRVHSTDAETGREVKAMGDAGLQINADGSNASSLGMMERNEDVLRKDPRTSLTMLAEQTGGFLVDGTNALGDAFRTIDHDRRFYYVLAYSPTNPNFGGEWRSVTVRVPGRKVHVRARSGYLAVRSASVLPVLAYEAPALALLDTTTPPRDIQVRVAAFDVPRTPADLVVPILVSVEAQRLAFEVSDLGFRTDFTIVAQLRDEAGEVVRKGSFRYRLHGPANQVEAARAGDVLFYRQPTVPPGAYTLEVVVLDSFGMRATVDRLPLDLHGSGTTRLGSVIVVQRTERVPPEEAADNPLHVGDVLAYPNLGEPVSVAGGVLGVLVSLVSKPWQVTAAQIDVLSAAAPVVTVPATLLPPDDDGRVRQLVAVPVGDLAPGEYDVRLTIVSNGAALERSTRVRLSR